jgi:tRNA U54 and U55 pseudouridine synthase Pus10
MEGSRLPIYQRKLTFLKLLSKRLEKEVLRTVYTLDLEKFGWRCADLLISTKDGKTSSVAKKLLSSDVVTGRKPISLEDLSGVLKKYITIEIKNRPDQTAQH